MSENQVERNGNETKRKEDSDNETNDKNTASEDKAQKHGGKAGTVLADINDDTKKKPQ